MGNFFSHHEPLNGSEASDYVKFMVQFINSADYWENNSVQPEGYGVPRSSVPTHPNINNLNSLLHDIYLRYIALNDVDFENYYNLVHKIFLQMHKTMKEVDPFYRKYSSTVQFVGSHPDHLRINKPNEFDIDIVINMPLSFKQHLLNPDLSDFQLQPSDPGFMQLKMGKQYQRLPQRDPSDWSINRRAYQWKDDENYLLRSKFLDWFKSVVSRALNRYTGGFNSTPTFYVDGVPYTVRRSESGPAMTLYIENKSRNIKLDIDLVVGLRFPIDRWPDNEHYRRLPQVCHDKEYWMIVPKLNKGGCSERDRDRSWRVSMHEQESMLMHDTRHMRQAIRLMKKLRDSQNMTQLSSYYIKTLFFWEIMIQEHNKKFWNNSPAFLFRHMLQRLYQALHTGYIPYFWNRNNNLIEMVHRSTLNRYSKIIGNLIEVLDEPSRYKEVAKYLLPSHEYKEYSEKFLNVPLTTLIFGVVGRVLLLLFCFIIFSIVTAR